MRGGRQKTERSTPTGVRPTEPVFSRNEVAAGLKITRTVVSVIIAETKPLAVLISDGFPFHDGVQI
jgi:hypothetical protein